MSKLTRKYSVDPDELRRLYVDEHLTTRQISALLNVPQRTICRYIKQAGIATRFQGPEPVMQLADKAWLFDQYVTRKKSTPEIAAELGCVPQSVARYLRLHGIEARSSGAEKGHKRNDSEEVREKMRIAKRDRFIGPDNPNWKGGMLWKDPERGRYRAKMWVKAVKDRDGWRCTKCGSIDRLHSHHIKPWRHYPELRYDVSNGTTLCHTCHEEAHGRGWEFRWKKVRPKSTSASVPEGDKI